MKNERKKKKKKKKKENTKGTKKEIDVRISMASYKRSNGIICRRSSSPPQ